MDFIKVFMIFFSGALCGSFFYTLALRYISGQVKNDPLTALFSSSLCPRCGMPIRKYHLIPIISFLLLKGRCSRCGKNIPFTYPVFEIIFGLLLLFTIDKLGLNPYSLSVYLLISVILVISIIDLKTLTIPDSLVILFLVISLFPLVSRGELMDSIYGMLLMFVFFAAILFIFPGSFGGGDIKLAAAIGLFLGLGHSVVALETSLVTGAITGVIYGITKERTLRVKIPFGPFLAIGFFVAVFYGKELILLYYNIFY